MNPVGFFFAWWKMYFPSSSDIEATEALDSWFDRVTMLVEF